MYQASSLPRDGDVSPRHLAVDAERARTPCYDRQAIDKTCKGINRVRHPLSLNADDGSEAREGGVEQSEHHALGRSPFLAFHLWLRYHHPPSSLVLSPPLAVLLEHPTRYRSPNLYSSCAPSSPSLPPVPRFPPAIPANIRHGTASPSGSAARWLT
ncbi:hypothetical protein MSAN_01691800 [Mycena sanguinolenta]|uniref:Uncharacterized protein n=1 Tax=Mycena sanguinolenta TaxID=230812 RepID=A0A8H6XWR4_9AGAR|nr:hypothetical protein MSAN_01691800 [Mycena sanguinolenta]